MLGQSLTLEQLESDPHQCLAELREREPVSWVPVLGGWLVTRYELVVAAMRDPLSFTVDDPRFSTARIVGPSMLSLDGPEHEHHRSPFLAPFRARAIEERFSDQVRSEAERLIDELRPAGEGELRRSFAGPLAAAVVAQALGMDRGDVGAVLGWYDRIVAAVTEITAGRGSGEDGRAAFRELAARLQPALEGDSLLAAAARSGRLDDEQIVSNAAVLLFGGIETTEGMIANTLLFLLKDPELPAQLPDHPELIGRAIEEALRLEPAAAVVDRYATADVTLGDTVIARGDLVRLSITAANRDPAVFERPDRFDLHRPRPRMHLAFAQGPHVCVGLHLARLEASTGIAALLSRFRGLHLDPHHPPEVRGLVFRKPTALYARWEPV